MDYKRAYGYEKSIYEYYVVGVVAFHGVLLMGVVTDA